MQSRVHLYRSTMWDVQGVTCYSFVAVFQSSSGQTGFDADETGKQLIREIMADAWTCGAGGASIGPLGENADPLKILARSPPRICFHSPTLELFGEFEKIRSYLAAKKLGELKAKFGRVIEQAVVPPLQAITCDSNVDEGLILEWLRDLCEMISVWPIDNSGYGSYGKFFTRQEAAVDSVKQHCEKIGVQVTTVEHLKQLPVW